MARMVIMMIEPILGITKVKNIKSYTPGEQYSRESFKRKPDANFQDILNRKIKSEQGSSPYQVILDKSRL